jgi:hypothetical protein
MNKGLLKHPAYFPLLAGGAWLLYGACVEFHQIAWGTGSWWGEYALSWGIALLLFVVFNIALLFSIIVPFWKSEAFQMVLHKIVSIRESLYILRWAFVFLLFIFPLWFLQHTLWGIVFHGIYIRLLIWSLTVVGLAFLLGKGKTVFGWNELIIAIILTSVEFTVGQAFLNVTDYPFSLGWSEGNRIWDYSVLFGRDVYNYPVDKEIPVLLDIGRQFVGGLPFLFPGLTIEAERAWIGVSVLLPYLLIGLLVFISERKNIFLWILTSLWVLLFLKQGPIHPPLVLCAALVAFTWRKPLWFALPSIAFIGYVAHLSRFTWMFAPGMWIGMLEFAGATLENGKLSRQTWIRAIALAVMGAVGGYFGPNLMNIFVKVSTDSGAISFGKLDEIVSEQPLLWYRLLPNSTYGNGILAGVFFAIFPLLIVLFYLVSAGKWKINTWQLLSMFFFLGAFLIVGLIVSTKIGGGGDLHNMDMFLIGLMFAGVLAWRSGGRVLILNCTDAPMLVRVALLLMFILPGIQPLLSLRTREPLVNPTWLVTLTDAASEKSLGLLPTSDVVEHSLQIIQQEVDRAQQNGDVLFMDQRQLLTFNYINNVLLVPEYEKKVLMDSALSSDAAYFAHLYEDLALKRFSLIVSEPLRTPIKDASYQFGEENNAWVKWVAFPVLCYYEPIETLKEVNVQLLAPKSGLLDCTKAFPQGYNFEN